MTGGGAAKAAEEAPIWKICPQSIGKQAQSQRNNAPMYSLSKCTREHRSKVFISKEASKGGIPLDTPGAIYDVATSTLNLSSGQAFSCGPKMVFGRSKNKYDWQNKKTDLLSGEVTEIANRMRYKKQRDVPFTKEPIGLANNIEIFKAHPIAFQGLDSPGPGPLPNIKKTSKYNNDPRMPFGVKTEIGSMYAGDKHTNPDVGPNSYPPLVSFGNQTLSQRRNASTHAFPRQPKFGREVKSKDEGPNVNLNLSAFGRQARGDKRSEQTVGFSLGTRGQAQRMTRCMTEKDSAAPTAKARMPHPPLPSERKAIAFSGSMGAFS
ncbi:unnamed protein product [Amoebophrya sp. A25]|nr:unnamed protein product [Amoebophrya sp. A25]|eukprot:GSA25T00000720001.1